MHFARHHQIVPYRQDADCMSVKAKSEGYLLEDLADGMKPDEWVCLQAYHFSLPIMPPKASTQGPELSLDFQRKRLLHIREERTRGSRRSMFKELIFTLSGFVEGKLFIHNIIPIWQCTRSTFFIPSFFCIVSQTVRDLLKHTDNIVHLRFLPV